jgi:vitamin B12 transporter
MPRITVLLAASLLGGGSVQAATQPQVVSSPNSLVVRDTLVVTASLAPESAASLPASVDVVTAEEIAARQSVAVLDLLRTLPGVAIVQSGSPGKAASLFVRGTGSNQTLVLWNGVSLNDPAFGGFDWSSLATDGLDRIEVVRGPYSALWGSSALGGVVQLVTRSAPGTAAGVRAEAGTNGYRRAGGWGSYGRSGLQVDLFGHWRRGDGELANDFFDSDELAGRVESQPLPSLRAGLVARRARAEIGLPFDFFGTPSPARRQKGTDTLVALPVVFAVGDWQVDGVVSRADHELGLADAADPFATSSTDARRDAGRVVVRRSLGLDAWAGGGIDVARESATTTSAFGPGLADDRQRTRSAFAQVGGGRGRFAGELGVRRDDNDAFGGETSWRGGLVANPTAGLRLRASYGESFRAPSLGDLYYPGFSNPDLRPERGRSAELGLELDRGPLRATLTGFANRLEDLILYDFASGRPENVGRARARGVELGLDGRWEGWSLRTSGTLLDSEDLDTGAPLPRRPRRSGQLVAFRTAERWSAGATWRFVGEREDVGRVKLPGYAAVDLAASWRGPRGLEPFLRVENALDRSYQEAVGFPAPGRSWVLGAAWRAHP